MPSKSTRTRSKAPASKKRRKTTIAETADRHELYQEAVQAVEAEIDFVDDTYKEIRGTRTRVLREDFAGTANTSCEWVRRRSSNVAYAIDLDEETQQWGAEHNIAKLKPTQRSRVTMITGDVRTTTTDEAPDIILAHNFSYFIFQKREVLREYFRTVRESLAPQGLLFLDCYGGYESFKECTDPKPLEDSAQTYIWDQHRYDPISGEMTCYIHFKFKDGSKLHRAFEYTWRMWTMPEIREVLEEAGFARSTVYWEGTDEDSGEGNGEFTPTERGEADPAWIAYIVAEP